MADLTDSKLLHKEFDQMIDHPIFIESIRQIQNQLGSTGLEPLQQQVLERLIHSSGDIDLMPLLSFSPSACQIGVSALNAGAMILTDTAMAAAGVIPMARRTLKPLVKSVLDWAPNNLPHETTRTAEGMKIAWLELQSHRKDLPSPIVVIGSAPTALETLLDLVEDGAYAPSLIIGMPVGFIGVKKSKSRLVNSGLPYILINGTKGGAGLGAATINALLRATLLMSKTFE